MATKQHLGYRIRIDNFHRSYKARDIKFIIRNIIIKLIQKTNFVIKISHKQRKSDSKYQKIRNANCVKVLYVGQFKQAEAALITNKIQKYGLQIKVIYKN